MVGAGGDGAFLHRLAEQGNNLVALMIHTWKIELPVGGWQTTANCENDEVDDARWVQHLEKLQRWAVPNEAEEGGQAGAWVGDWLTRLNVVKLPPPRCA